MYSEEAKLSLKEDLDGLEGNAVQEEDLGFDPWGESTKALQDLMKIEKTSNEYSEAAHIRAASGMAPINGFPLGEDVNAAYGPRNFYQKMYMDNYQNSLGHKFSNSMFKAEQQVNLIPGLYCGYPAFKNLTQQELAEPMYSNQFQGACEAHQQSYHEPGPAFVSDSYNPFQVKNNLSKAIVPPPGFTGGLAFPSPNLTSSASNSSTSSSTSSLNNSASTTPALNNNLFKANTGK